MDEIEYACVNKIKYIDEFLKKRLTKSTNPIDYNLNTSIKTQYI